MNQNFYVIYITVNPIHDFLFYTYNRDIYNYLQNLIHYCTWPAICRGSVELSLFKQDQINLAHFLSKLITIRTDELIDD